LSLENQKKIANYCDLSEKRLRAKFCEVFDDTTGRLLARIPATRPE
jgi:hypothetical protein